VAAPRALTYGPVWEGIKEAPLWIKALLVIVLIGGIATLADGGGDGSQTATERQ
jgi:hypothetical protein